MPSSPRSFKCRRKAVQLALSSFDPSATASTSRNPSSFTPIASSETLRTSPPQLRFNHKPSRNTYGCFPSIGRFHQLLNLRVDLLVQLAYLAGADPRAPQRFGDVFDSSYAHSRKIHLHQRFFHRAFSPPVAFDDRNLKRQRAQLRHFQRHFARFGLEVSLVGTRPRVFPRLRPFVPLGPAKTVRFRVQHGV